MRSEGKIHFSNLYICMDAFYIIIPTNSTYLCVCYTAVPRVNLALYIKLCYNLFFTSKICIEWKFSDF